MAAAKKRDNPKKHSGGLTERSIKQRVGQRSFQRGQEYFHSGAIFDCRRQGELLKARCRGQSANYYSLRAQLKKGRVDEAACDCPVGEGGYCKHMAALLLTWLHMPEEFLETEPLEKRLGDCSKSQLIELIGQMVEQEPDLEGWLEIAAPSGTSATDPVTPDVYRQRTIAAFRGADYDWRGQRQLIAALEALVKLGEQFRARKNIESAAAVYCGVLMGIISEYETIDDEPGGVFEVALECREALESFLPQLAEGSEARRFTLQALFDVIRFDIDSGGMGISDGTSDVFIQHATPDERAVIVGWIRKEKPKGDGSSQQWRLKAWGGLLLELEDKVDDDDAYLRHCRTFGLTSKLVERLLERGRLDEALREIRAASGYELTQHADRLIAHKHRELALSLVRERLNSARDDRGDAQLRDWLKRFYQTRKDWRSLLELWEEDFRRKPSLTSYQEIRRCAGKLKIWDSLRPQVLAGVPRSSGELIRIHLEEGEIARAIELWEAREKAPRRGAAFYDFLDFEVARASEKSHPATALKIYRAEAERLIALRGRENYQAACEHLKKARQLFKASGGRKEDWSAYIEDLRQQNRSLRALHEELAKAGL